MSTPSAQELLHTMGDRLQGSAHVRNVYGEPVTLGDKTIIPVARIGYGFGAGSGGKHDKAGGGGGGGGVAAEPIGVVEITPQGTKLIRFVAAKRLAAAAGVGFLLGALLARRKKR